MRRWITWILLAGLAAAAAGGWYWYTRPPASVAPTTVAVTRGDIERTVLAAGIIEASSLVSVGAEVSGRIKALHVGLGDAVKAGDAIAEIDSLNQENAVRLAEAGLASVSAQKKQQDASLAQARVALDRAEKLRPQNLISDADYQSAQLAVTTAEAQQDILAAQIQQAEINVDTANLNLDRTRIVAPADGTVVSVEVEVGQTVNAANSSPTIVKVANLDNMVVKAEISEADIPRVEAGQNVYFTILGDPDTRINATLRAIEPAPETISGTASTSLSSTAVYYNGLFDVPNPDHHLRISMTAQVTIVLDAVKDALTIPASVLGRRGGDGSYEVSVWNAAARVVEERRIGVGLSDNITAEVTSGLAEGDAVVTTQLAVSGASSQRSGTTRNLLSGGPSGPPAF